MRHCEIVLEDGKARRFGPLGFSVEGERLRRELVNGEQLTDDGAVEFLYDVLRPAIERSLRAGGNSTEEIEAALCALTPVPVSQELRAVVLWLGFGVEAQAGTPRGRGGQERQEKAETEIETPMGARVVMEC